MIEAPIYEAQIGFIKAFHDLIQTVRIHQDNKQLTRKVVGQFCDRLSELTAGRDLRIFFWRGRFHVCNDTLPYCRHARQIISAMAAYFAARDLGGLCFSDASRRIPPEAILSMIHLLDESVKHHKSPDWLDEQCARRGFSWIMIFGKLTEQQTAGLETSEGNYMLELTGKARGLYLNALQTIREIAFKASRGRVGLRNARRLSQDMVDLIQEVPSVMLGLATIKDYDDYTYTHSVNVALLSTCLGRQIGLSRVSLEHLCICGLFHDLGKAGVPKDILYKQEGLSHAEWEELRKHPLRGIQEILQLQAPQELRSRIILGPFEHHLNPDLSGYPKTHFMKRLSLLGRILRIADVYEALTADRAYRDRAFNPGEALSKMWREGERRFDPLLLKAFIHMMGVYPIGSIIELEDQRLGLVMDYTDPEDRTRPLVMFLNHSDTGEMTGGAMLNLALDAAGGDAPTPSIRQCLHPSRLGLQVASFFLQERP